jgi:pimeloyl-ACP methyl ester carboxylesterase
MVNERCTRSWLVIVMVALALALLDSPDIAVVRDIPVAARTTRVRSGRPVVLLAGLFGSAFGYRKIVALLAERGYRAVVIKPLGFGWSPLPHRANYSLSAQTRKAGGDVAVRRTVR